MEFVVKLCELLITYNNAFRLRLGQDPPANVRPLKIELKPDAKPKRIAARSTLRPRPCSWLLRWQTWSVLAWLRGTWPPGGQAHH
jgi:hypothetical protein